MKICGLQKLTALDFPGRLACTVFTPGCDLRCGFCHNAALVTAGNLPELIPEAEIFAFLEKRRGILDGVCFTGGEPLLQPDLGDFLSRVKALDFLVKLDTNGMHPRALAELIDSGFVDYVAMDIKNSRHKYAATCGVPGLDTAPVDRSLALLLEGRVDYELRTTLAVPLHEMADIEAMGGWIKGAKRWFFQQFVDSGGLISEGLEPQTKEFMLAAKAAAEKYVSFADVRGI